MATKSRSKKTTIPVPTIKLERVDISAVQRGDTVRITNNPLDDEWFVIDVGNPFVMIENLTTHFAYLYHSTTFYKQI